jgi:hypothetical protein
MKIKIVGKERTGQNKINLRDKLDLTFFKTWTFEMYDFEIHKKRLQNFDEHLNVDL